MVAAEAPIVYDTVVLETPFAVIVAEEHTSVMVIEKVTGEAVV